MNSKIELYKSKSGIYEIVNISNNKKYVGSAVDLYVRYKKHINDLNANRHDNYHLQRSYNKNGIDGFKFNIIESYDSIENKKLLDREQFFIDKFRVVETGYNIQPTAGNCFGMKRIRESIIKSAQKRSGINHHFYGKKLSEEHRKKISESNSSEKNWNYGNKASSETRKKQSLAKIGMYVGEKNPSAKLTYKIADQIRSIYNKKNTSQRLLAKKFGVSKTTIADILNNRKWVK